MSGDECKGGELKWSSGVGSCKTWAVKFEIIWKFWGINGGLEGMFWWLKLMGELLCKMILLWTKWNGDEETKFENLNCYGKLEEKSFMPGSKIWCFYVCGVYVEEMNFFLFIFS